MKYICKFSSTCGARGYCIHSRPHDVMQIKTRIGDEIKCKDKRSCEYLRSEVNCIESHDDN